MFNQLMNSARVGVDYTRDASGNITGLAGAGGAVIPLPPSGGMPSQYATRTNTSFPRPVTPTVYFKMSDTSMTDGSIKTTQTDVIAGKTATIAGTARHEWCHVNGNSGLYCNGTNTVMTLADATFQPFRQDQSWAMECCFTYPSSIRTGGAKNYMIVGSMDATGAVNYQGFAFWIKWDGGTADTGNAMPQGTGGANGRMIPQVQLVGVAGSDQKYINATTYNLIADIPHHALVVYDASSYPTTSVLSLYIDGILIGSVSDNKPTVSSYSNGTAMWVGNRKNDTLWFNGTVSDVAVYQNTLLTAAQRYAIAGPAYAPKQSVIYDSALCNDAGQPQDMMILAQYHKYGLINFAGVMTDGVVEKAPAANRAMLNYIGVRPRFGAWGGSSASAPGGPPAAGGADYSANVQTKFPVPQEVSPYGAGATLRSDFVPSLAQLVYILASLPNGSVTYWMASFSTVLNELFAASNATIGTAVTSAWSAGAWAGLQSKLVADGSGASPTGATIAKLKIGRIVVHGGFYPTSLAVGNGASEDVANSPEYNFRSDATRWHALLGASGYLATAATIKVDHVSMADAPGNVEIGLGIQKASLNANSSNPMEVAYQATASQLNTAGERTCYNAWSLTDLVFPNQVGQWVQCNDVEVDNSNARTSASYNSYGENTFLTVSTRPNRWLAVNKALSTPIKTMLQTLMNLS